MSIVLEEVEPQITSLIASSHQEYFSVLFWMYPLSAFPAKLKLVPFELLPPGGELGPGRLRSGIKVS